MIGNPRLDRDSISDSRGCAGGLVLRADLRGVIHRAGGTLDEAKAEYGQSKAGGKAAFRFRRWRR